MTCRAAVLLATAASLAASPVEARERRHHRDHGDGVAAFVAGAVIAGGQVALIAGKKSGDAHAPLPELSPDENEAANLCADAAERQLWDDGDGREARVEGFDSVTPREDGGFKVKGRLRAADGGDGYRMRFACTVKGAEVRSVTVSI